MTAPFDKDFWNQHWASAPQHAPGAMATNPPNPHLLRETAELVPGTALDAGCGAGAESIALAAAGWDVTGVDISDLALHHARERAENAGVAAHTAWLVADLVTWHPDTIFDLVMSHYAHPAMPQLDFYTRIAAWVKPGGTLLIVGHLHLHDDHDASHETHHHPDEVAVTAEAIVQRLPQPEWQIVTADEPSRQLQGRNGQTVTLHDVVVRATRRA